MSAGFMKSKFRPSSVRPSSVCGIDYLRTYCMDLVSQTLVVGCPGPCARTFCFNLKMHFEILYTLFSFSLVWDPVGAKMSKYHSPTNRSRKLSSFPEFSSQWSSQNYVCDFWNFDWSFNDLFSFSLIWGPNGSKKKAQTSKQTNKNHSNATPTNRSQKFQTFPAFSSPWSLVQPPDHLSPYAWDFLSFELMIFNGKFQIYHCTVWGNVNYPVNDYP